MTTPPEVFKRMADELTRDERWELECTYDGAIPMEAVEAIINRRKNTETTGQAPTPDQGGAKQ